MAGGTRRRPGRDLPDVLRPRSTVKSGELDKGFERQGDVDIGVGGEQRWQSTIDRVDSEACLEDVGDLGCRSLSEITRADRGALLTLLTTEADS